VDSAEEEAAMRKGKTHFEQVPIEMAETVLKKAATLAAILQASPDLFPMLDREVAPPPSKQRAKFLLMEHR
jgi:hypothetical protein